MTSKVLSFIILLFLATALLVISGRDARSASTMILGDVVSPITMQTMSVTATATGTLIPAVTGKMIKVAAYKLVTSASMSVSFNDGASTVLESPQGYAAGSVIIEGSGPPFPLFATTAGNPLYIVIAGSGTVTGRINYWSNDSQ